MPEVVVFRYEAPLAAFGNLAVGERRGSRTRPSHSAITGLIASAFGIGRDDQGHEEIAQGFLLAIRTDKPGEALSDFHTAQTPPQRRGARYATRKEELRNKRNLGTIISRRDYYTEACFTVLLWLKDGYARPAASIADALNRPAFIPYAGRRSCPFGTPPAARVLQVETVSEAFDAYDAITRCDEKQVLRSRKPVQVALDRELWEEGCRGEISSTMRSGVVRDRLVSRVRWQFEPRVEIVAELLEKKGGQQP